MSPTSDDAFVAQQIPALAVLYDRFAHALDPFSPATDEAERVFVQNIATLYDNLSPPKPAFIEFRKGVIVRCKRHLAAGDTPPTI